GRGRSAVHARVVPDDQRRRRQRLQLLDDAERRSEPAARARSLRSRDRDRSQEAVLVIRRSRAFKLGIGAAFLAAPLLARAGDGFDLEVWQPVHDGTGTFTTRGAGVLDPYETRAGVSIDY